MLSCYNRKKLLDITHFKFWSIILRLDLFKAPANDCHLLPWKRLLATKCGYIFTAAKIIYICGSQFQKLNSPPPRLNQAFNFAKKDFLHLILFY